MTCEKPDDVRDADRGLTAGDGERDDRGRLDRVPRRRFLLEHGPGRLGAGHVVGLVGQPGIRKGLGGRGELLVHHRRHRHHGHGRAVTHDQVDQAVLGHLGTGRRDRWR